VDAQNPKKNPKKAHRGYAFIVYEREKDMKGIEAPALKFS
jgi:U1 small nuclear ribonucleoprotein